MKAITQQYTTVSRFLANGFNLDTDIIPDCESNCAICGVHAPVIAVDRVLKKASSGVADTFRGEYVCLACAACYGASRPTKSQIGLVGNLFATESYAVRPMVAQSNATTDRPSWRDIVRGLADGTRTTAIFTSNTKRRLWTQSVVSPVGSAWRVLYVHENDERLLTVDHALVCQQLDTIEALLTEGYSKATIGSDLITDYKRFAADPQRVLALEAELSAIRHTDDFTLALFIAQGVQSE